MRVDLTALWANMRKFIRYLKPMRKPADGATSPRLALDAPATFQDREKESQEGGMGKSNSGNRHSDLARSSARTLAYLLNQPNHKSISHKEGSASIRHCLSIFAKFSPVVRKTI